MSVRFPFHHLPSYTLATLRANSPQSPRFAHSPLLSVSTLDLSSTLILRKAPDLRTCVLLSVFRSDWTRLLPRCFSCYPSILSGTCYLWLWLYLYLYCLSWYSSILSGTCPIWEPNTQDSSWLFDGNMQTKCARGDLWYVSHKSKVGCTKSCFCMQGARACWFTECPSP